VAYKTSHRRPALQEQLSIGYLLTIIGFQLAAAFSFVLAKQSIVAAENQHKSVQTDRPFRHSHSQAAVIGMKDVLPVWSVSHKPLQGIGRRRIQGARIALNIFTDSF
jgi:hypothetical protein